MGCICAGGGAAYGNNGRQEETRCLRARWNQQNAYINAINNCISVPDENNVERESERERKTEVVR